MNRSTNPRATLPQNRDVTVKIQWEVQSATCSKDRIQSYQSVLRFDSQHKSGSIFLEWFHIYIYLIRFVAVNMVLVYNSCMFQFRYNLCTYQTNEPWLDCDPVRVPAALTCSLTAGWTSCGWAWWFVGWSTHGVRTSSTCSNTPHTRPRERVRTWGETKGCLCYVVKWEHVR